MKKKVKVKKLVLQKETLTRLQHVTGGTDIYYTVIIEFQSDYCGEDTGAICDPPVYT